jgi:hypothetical protein
MTQQHLSAQYGYGTPGKVTQLSDYRLGSTGGGWNKTSSASGTNISSGNGGGSGVNERIAKLESDVGHIKTDMGDIKNDVRSIKNNGAKTSDVQELKGGQDSLWRWGLSAVAFILVAGGSVLGAAYFDIDDDISTIDNNLETMQRDIDNEIDAVQGDISTLAVKVERNDGKILNRLDDVIQALPTSPRISDEQTYP